MRYLVKFYDFGALTCFCGMTALVLMEVLTRNVLLMPTTWAEEASRFLCVWTIFLGSASAWFRGSHIIVNVLMHRLFGRNKLLLTLIAQILSALFLVATWAGSISIIIVSYPAKTTGLELSVSYLYLALFLGLTGMIIFHADQMRRTISDLIRP